MRKTASILLLSILLFNFAGYRLLFYLIEQKQEARLVTQLDDQNYSTADLITITVPLSLPYQTDWKDFERVDGEIQFQGKTYHYIKRKIENGNLILQCIADNAKMQLQSAKQQYADNASDIQNNNPASKKQSDANTNLIKLLTTDCIENNQDNCQHQCAINKNINNIFSSYSLSRGFKPLPTKPPEA